MDKVINRAEVKNHININDNIHKAKLKKSDDKTNIDF